MAGTGELHRLQPQEETLSQPDNKVDIFLAPPVRQIRPMSTTFRLFLHDIPWKGAFLPLSGMQAWLTSCLRLDTQAWPERGVLQKLARSFLQLQPGRCPKPPCTPVTWPTEGRMGAPSVPVTWCCTILRGAGCQPWYAASSY